MAEQETLTINLSQICQLKKVVILTKELPIKGSLLVVVPMLTQVPVQHIAAIVITYQQMYAARMAESVDALVSNTSGAIRAGSIPAPGTQQNASA